MMTHNNTEDPMGNTNTANDFWAGAEVISTYTRAQAIEDGVLVEMPEDLLREAGIRFPMALTAAAFCAVIDVDEGDAADGQDVTGRIWDVLNMYLFAVRRSTGGRSLRFKVAVQHGRKRRVHLLEAVCGPGDNAEPVLTVDEVVC